MLFLKNSFLICFDNHTQFLNMDPQTIYTIVHTAFDEVPRICMAMNVSESVCQDNSFRITLVVLIFAFLVYVMHWVYNYLAKKEGDKKRTKINEQAAITRASTEEIKHFATVVSTLLHTGIPNDMMVKEMKRKFASLMPVTRERLGVKDEQVETEEVKEETTDEPIVATPRKARSRSPSRARRGRS
jgi:Mg2+/Co2+ transporter CorB